MQHRSFLKPGRSPLPCFSLVHATLSKPQSSTSGSWMRSAAAPKTTAGWTLNQHGLCLVLPSLRRNFSGWSSLISVSLRPSQTFYPFVCLLAGAHMSWRLDAALVPKSQSLLWDRSARGPPAEGLQWSFGVDVISQVWMGSQIAYCDKQAVWSRHSCQVKHNQPKALNSDIYFLGSINDKIK